MNHYHRPKHETQHRIITYVAQGNGATRTQIADALGRVKTPHLIAIIDNLVDEGYLLRDVKTFMNGVQGYVYHINPDAPYPDAPQP